MFAHASWTPHRADSYERLAFLGDSVLSLAVTRHLYPRLEAGRFGAGRLTKIRAQAVSRRSCAIVAERMRVAERLEAAAPETAMRDLARTESVRAEVVEAIIGACFLEFGFETTASAVVKTFAPEIKDAMTSVTDFKSVLQERLARRGETVSYSVTAELGPPHERTFEVVATVAGARVGEGSGRSKKDAEQAAAEAALEDFDDGDGED